jgi:hypothetical protein
MGANEHGDVGGHLVVARARGVQLPPHRAGDLGDAALDRHVDVLVVVAEGEAPLVELASDLVERREQLVAVAGLDDALLREHAHVRPRLGDVVRAQAPVEADRGVKGAEGVVLGLGEAGHAPPV